LTQKLRLLILSQNSLLKLVVTCIIFLHYFFIFKLLSRIIKEYYYIIFVFLFAKCQTLQELQVNYCLQTKKILTNLSFATRYLVAYVLINLRVNLVGIFLFLLLIIEKEFFAR